MIIAITATTKHLTSTHIFLFIQFPSFDIEQTYNILLIFWNLWDHWGGFSFGFTSPVKLDGEVFLLLEVL